MLNVSDEFKAAVLADTRQFVPRVRIWIADNRTRGYRLKVTPSVSDFESCFPDDRLFNGKTAAVEKWALARDDCYPADDLYPIEQGWEGGWLGDCLSDSDGYLDPALEITLEFESAEMVNSLELYGDEWLGYPVDFTWYRWNAETSAWVEILDVTGNDSAVWSYTVSAYWMSTKFKVVIQRISRANDHPALIEVQVALYDDISDDVISFEVIRERYYREQGTLPIGNSAAAELLLVLQNVGAKYDRFSPSNIYYNNMLPNQQIQVELGLVLDSGVEYCPIGTFYTVSWEMGFQEPTVRIRALDKSRQLLRTYYYSLVLQGYTIGELVEELAQAAGLGADKISIGDTEWAIPYAWFGEASVWEELRELAIGEGGFVYFDEAGTLIFENRDYLVEHSTTSVATLTDENCIVDILDSVDESRLCTVVRVEIPQLIEGTEETIWQLQEPITVAPGGKEIEVEFDNVAMDIQAPVITSGGEHISIIDYNYTALGGTIQLWNSGTSDETVDTMYITGTPLEETGQLVCQVRSAMANSFGEITKVIHNRYIQSYAQAYEMANDLIASYSDPGNELVVRMPGRGLPHLQLGDKVAVWFERPIIDGDYWVVRHLLRYDGSLDSELTLLRVPD
jgi:hypothetical protein